MKEPSLLKGTFWELEVILCKLSTLAYWDPEPYICFCLYPKVSLSDVHLGYFCTLRPSSILYTDLTFYISHLGQLQQRPWTGHLKQQKFVFSQFWRLGSQEQGAGRFISGETSLPGLHVFLLCIYMGGEAAQRTHTLASFRVRTLTL